MATDWTKETIEATDWTPGTTRPTNWTPGSVLPTDWDTQHIFSGYILLETGDHLLNENGNSIIAG